MFLQFSVDNFRSIKDTLTFSMLTASKDKNNTFNIGKYDILTSAVVYGANASGKSNILKAMAFMRSMVLNNDKVLQSTDTLKYDPFRLNTSTIDASSSFEMIFFINNIKYRYGFEADQTRVYSEWLYEDTTGRKEAKLFFRDEDEEHYVNKLRFQEGYDFFNVSESKIKIAKNQLFIWKCDQNEGPISKSILKWFVNFNLIDGIDHSGYTDFTIEMMKDTTFKSEIVKLVKTADIGIENVVLKEEEIPEDFFENSPFSEEFLKILFEKKEKKYPSLKTYHKLFNANDEEVGETVFSLNNEESVGTQKFFKISAPIIDTLKDGGVLLIDELDSSLHPILTKHLIALFNDKEINTNNAQLIFATHDTNLLKPYIFRRDQVWLCEKDKYGATHAYSLAQIKGVLKNEDFEKQYIQGKYGAIPYLGKFEF